MEFCEMQRQTKTTCARKFPPLPRLNYESSTRAVSAVSMYASCVLLKSFEAPICAPRIRPFPVKARLLEPRPWSGDIKGSSLRRSDRRPRWMDRAIYTDLPDYCTFHARWVFNFEQILGQANFFWPFAVSGEQSAKSWSSRSLLIR